MDGWKERGDGAAAVEAAAAPAAFLKPVQSPELYLTGELVWCCGGAVVHHGALVQTSAPGPSDDMVPWCHGAMVSGCHGASEGAWRGRASIAAGRQSAAAEVWWLLLPVWVPYTPTSTVSASCLESGLSLKFAHLQLSAAPKCCLHCSEPT